MVRWGGDSPRRQCGGRKESSAAVTVPDWFLRGLFYFGAAVNVTQFGRHCLHLRGCNWCPASRVEQPG